MQFDPTLYVITDSTYHTAESLLRAVDRACAGGATLIQLREKDAGGRDYLALAQQVKAVTDPYQVPLIIDDRVDVALACGAAGVHVGASDLPVAVCRRLLGPDKIVGATANRSRLPAPPMRTVRTIWVRARSTRPPRTSPQRSRRSPR